MWTHAGCSHLWQDRARVNRVTVDPGAQHRVHAVVVLVGVGDLGKQHIGGPRDVVPVADVVGTLAAHRLLVHVLAVVALDVALRLAEVVRVTRRDVQPRGTPRHVVQHARGVVQSDCLGLVALQTEGKRDREGGNRFTAEHCAAHTFTM
eukprot:364282-Chlamydomonas_euryale.AAC.19